MLKADGYAKAYSVGKVPYYQATRVAV